MSTLKPSSPPSPFTKKPNLSRGKILLASPSGHPLTPVLLLAGVPLRRTSLHVCACDYAGAHCCAYVCVCACALLQRPMISRTRIIPLRMKQILFDFNHVLYSREKLRKIASRSLHVSVPVCHELRKIGVAIITTPIFNHYHSNFQSLPLQFSMITTPIFARRSPLSTARVCVSVFCLFSLVFCLSTV